VTLNGDDDDDRCSLVRRMQAVRLIEWRRWLIDDEANRPADPQTQAEM